MDIDNLWKETGDRRTDGINVIKSWLCGSTDGQTYSISNAVLDFDVELIEKLGFAYEFPEKEFDDIVGFNHFHRIDDPDLDALAEEMYESLIKLNADVVEHPERFFQRISYTPHVQRCGLPSHIHGCDYAAHDAKTDADDCTNCGYCPFKSYGNA